MKAGRTGVRVRSRPPDRERGRVPRRRQGFGWIRGSFRSLRSLHATSPLPLSGVRSRGSGSHRLNSPGVLPSALPPAGRIRSQNSLASLSGRRITEGALPLSVRCHAMTERDRRPPIPRGLFTFVDLRTRRHGGSKGGGRSHPFDPPASRAAAARQRAGEVRRPPNPPAGALMADRRTAPPPPALDGLPARDHWNGSDPWRAGAACENTQGPAPVPSPRLGGSLPFRSVPPVRR